MVLQLVYTGSIAAMSQAHARQKVEAAQQQGQQRQQQEGGEEELSFPTSTPRLRVDLQLDDLSGLSDDWARAVQHRYLPFYEKVGGWVGGWIGWGRRF